MKLLFSVDVTMQDLMDFARLSGDWNPLHTDQDYAEDTTYGGNILHGAYSKIMQDSHGQIEESYSVSAGLDYPAVGPEHVFLQAAGRARYFTVTDTEALAAFHALAKNEGIIPALESAHALAYALKIAEQRDGDSVLLVNLSGRGDKDLDYVRSLHTQNNIAQVDEEGY